MKQLIALIMLTLAVFPCPAQDFYQVDTTIGEAILPLRHLRPTSAFGWRIHPITGRFQFHAGIDLAARQDTVFSILTGLVAKIGYNSFIGNYILITHPGDVQSLYGHLSCIAVLPGEPVAAGQAIGITGVTGRVTGQHLHFSIKYRGRELPPLAFLGSLFIKPP